VLSKRALREFWDQHSDARTPLLRWWSVAVEASGAASRMFTRHFLMLTRWEVASYSTFTAMHTD
jgi:hypothetical protein